MQPERFDLLLSLYLNGEAASDEAAELERMLCSDSSKRRRLVDACLLEVQLHKVFGAILPADQEFIPPVKRSRRTRVWISALAATIFLAVGVVALFRSGIKPTEERGSEVVAGQVRINGASVPTIPAGRSFEVIGDVPAIIRLADGSRAELEPATKAAIQSRAGEDRQLVELAQGGGAFQVTHGGGKFRVETPVGAVIALGTEFTVKLRQRAKKKPEVSMTVAVTSGTVQVETKGNRYTLTAGKSRVYSDDGEHNQNDDGQKNQNDDGQMNQNDNGQKNQKNDGQRNQNDDGQKNQNDNGNNDSQQAPASRRSK